MEQEATSNSKDPTSSHKALQDPAGKGPQGPTGAFLMLQGVEGKVSRGSGSRPWGHQIVRSEGLPWRERGLPFCDPDLLQCSYYCCSTGVSCTGDP